MPPRSTTGRSAQPKGAPASTRTLPLGAPTEDTTTLADAKITGGKLASASTTSSTASSSQTEEIDPRILGVPGLKTLSTGDHVEILWRHGAPLSRTARLRPHAAPHIRDTPRRAGWERGRVRECVLEMRKGTPVIIYRITYDDGEEVPPPRPARPPSLCTSHPTRGTRLANDYPILTVTLTLIITPWTLGPAPSSSSLTPLSRAHEQVAEDLRALPVRRSREGTPEQDTQSPPLSQHGAPPERAATRRDSGVNVAVPWRLREASGEGDATDQAGGSGGAPPPKRPRPMAGESAATKRPRLSAAHGGGAGMEVKLEPGGVEVHGVGGRLAEALAEGDSNVFAVERILGERRRSGRAQFLIRWLGCAPANASPTPSARLAHASPTPRLRLAHTLPRVACRACDEAGPPIAACCAAGSTPRTTRGSWRTTSPKASLPRSARGAGRNPPSTRQSTFLPATPLRLARSAGSNMAPES